MLHLFRRAFRHNAWANAMLLAALLAAEDVPLKAIAAFQHILETEHTWFGRLTGAESPNVPLWHDPSLARCVDWFQELAAQQEEYFHTLGGEDLVHQCSYRTRTGADYTDRVDNILMQALLHSAQYRGEAAGFAGAAGITAPDIDYIFWMRQGEPGYKSVGV